ncbi:LOW QUALITY PROTEIN: hypothetical protein PHMEG_00020341 [Phytophthora megakarya]|uniref:Chromo domain-containing protein n=1 Tax=Phytophthora megakarya TaxID=4795 RepID=A0A225VR51_9STRA|nr:LOW QUALITY PROTEIN: hypothetical protein PHMEG_00020341 [Phytophthora megakarya]
MGGIRDRQLHYQSDVQDDTIETRGDGDIESSDIINNPENKPLPDGRKPWQIGPIDTMRPSDHTRSRPDLASDRLKEGYARKLAHLWHGPFRVAEKINEFSIMLEIAGTGYQIFPVVHVSKLKLVKDFTDRPRVELTVDEAERLDFDEILLPDDSWVPDLVADEYEVERIADVRSGKKTRFDWIYREFLVHWAGYDEPTWVDEADLKCGAIMNAFLRERANQNRFNVMQSHEEM